MSHQYSIQVVFQNPKTGDQFPLRYRIFENTFTERWLTALQTALNKGDKIENNGNFFGAAFIDEGKVRAEMAECVRTINGYKQRWIPAELDPHPNMTNDFLLKLHGEFERLEPHPEMNRAKTPSKVRSALTQLNILIHQYQTFFSPNQLHIDINYNPVRRYSFEKHEYELFTTTRKWGTVYLAYGVTGVPVLDAYYADHRVAAVPQDNFTPGMCLYFGKDRESAKGPGLRKWLQEVYGWDMDDPSLALGYIPLGEIDSRLSPAEITEQLRRHPSVKEVLIDSSSELAARDARIEPFVAPRKTSAVATAPAPNTQPATLPSTLEQQNPRIHITLENETDASDLELVFALRDHAVSRKWIELVRRSLEDSSTSIIGNGKFYGFQIAARTENAARAQREIGNLLELGFQKHTDFDLAALSKQGAIEALDNTSLGRLVAHLKSLDRKEPALPSQTLQCAHSLIEVLNQMQSCGESPFEGHVNVDLSPALTEKLSDEDYRLFSLDRAWGELSLSYGKMGLPPMNAFYGRSTDEFHPQSEIANGLVMSFYPDHRFEDWDELNAWLKTRTGLFYDQLPKLGAGAIPLGNIVSVNRQSVESLNKEEVALLVRAHRRVKKVRVVDAHEPEQATSDRAHAALSESPKKSRYSPILDKGSLSAAKWPSAQEIYYHLEHTPWIFLPVDFDAQACVREAQALMNRAVVHRPYDQSGSAGNWKSLGIRALRGDPTKTENHTSYGVQEPDYELTEIADLCPNTLKMLESLTDIDQCHRIRFMFLEPGARISVHSDAPDRDSAFAVNIALNMPEGCEFHIDANPDGTHNAYTRKIPIEAGSAFILNNAKYHYLFNHSNETRVHLIIHGPIRFSDNQILEYARKQNKMRDGKELLNSLVRKYASLGRSIASDSMHFKDWLISGVCGSCLPSDVRLAAVTSPKVEPGLEKENLDRITIASLFPMQPPVVREDRMDQWLVKQVNTGGKYAVLIGSGTYVPSPGKFMIELLRAISTLEASDAIVMGQIISRKNEPAALPFMHEQFMILHLERWKAAGFTSVGEPYSGKPFEMIGFDESPHHIHDDYTPLWLKRSRSSSKRKGIEGYGTRLIHRSLELNRSVINVPLDLRTTKKFSYPRAGRDWQYREIRESIDQFLKRESERVFVFNNEGLTISDYRGFKPDSLISVAAGMKPLSLLNQFWGLAPPEKTSLIDFSPSAVRHFEKVKTAGSFEELSRVLSGEFETQSPGLKDPLNAARERLRQTVNDAFAGDTGKLLHSLSQLRDAELVNGDFIQNPDVILSRLKRGRKTLFWHSNAWSSNVAYYIHSQSELEEIYRELIREAQALLGTKAWRRSWGFEAVLGETLESPQAIFTDGLSMGFNPAEFKEL